jgi:Mg-chelatase subunit ChlD
MLSELFSAEFQSPGSLWLILPALILAGSLAFICYRRKLNRETLSLLVRAVILALMVFVVADPVRRSSESSEQIVALVDVSASITGRGLQAFTDRLVEFVSAGRNSAMSIAVYPFAKGVERSPIIVGSSVDSAKLARELSSRAALLDRGETNLAGALQQVSAATPGSSIVLLSDGFENVGDARQSARTIGSSGSRIYPLIPAEEPFRAQTLELSMLSAPLTAKAGDLAEVRVTARNTTGREQSGKIELYFNDRAILSQNLTVPAGQERLVTGKTPALEGGLHRVRAVLTGAAGSQELHRWISARKKASLLMLSGASEDERVLKQLLSLKGYTVRAIVADGREKFPENLEDTSGVIFNNVAEQQLPRGFLGQVKTFVERGGGVLLLGGDRSFGLGGYINTPLEEISPLKFVPPQTAKRRLVKAVALLIDKSRSMSTDGNIEAARDACLMAIRSLQDDDYVTVIGFDATAFVVIRMAKVSEIRAQAPYRLANLVAMGRTDLLPAMIEGRRALSKAPADRKHMIVLTDGKIPYAGQEYIQELARLRQEGVTLSGVALGRDADIPFIQMLSQYGRGAFYQTLSGSKLPEIFIQDIKVATGEKTIKERAEFPVGLGPAGLLSASVERFPPLRGFVETQPKASASIELITKGDERVSPLLASWKYRSAGKVIAFTSDANGRWSLPWLNWEGFARFWTQIIEEIENAPGESATQLDFDLRSTVNRGGLFLDLSVYDEKLRSSSPPRISGEVVLPGGEKRQVQFLPERKGRFKAVVEGARPGDYRVQILYGKEKLPPIGITLDGSVFGEVAGRGLNRESLTELASITGGSVNPDLSQLTRREQVTESVEHLFPPLAILAWLLFLFEVLFREVGIRSLFRRVLRRRRART